MCFVRTGIFGASIVRRHLQSYHYYSVRNGLFGEWRTYKWKIFGESYLKAMDELCGILKPIFTANLVNCPYSGSSLFFSFFVMQGVLGQLARISN